jgi:hypothetical protein
VIPALRRLTQEDLEFNANLGYIDLSQKNRKKSLISSFIFKVPKKNH